MNRVGYEFFPSEHGIFVEIYLPKKAEFQGTLYQALTEGFDLAKVRLHFREKRERINEFLRDKIQCDDRIEEMGQVFYGYSMYEVDGVYYDSKKKAISEERNQVIRIMFRPDLEKDSSILSPATVRLLAEEYLRHIGDRKDFLRFYESAHSELTGAELEETARVVSNLEGWEADVVLFVFGYIVFEICERIRELRDKRADAEEEILVTSFWNLTFNRVVKIR